MSKASITDYVENISERRAFKILQATLRAHQYPTSTGASDLLEKLENYRRIAPKNSPHLLETVIGALNNSINFHNKISQIFSFKGRSKALKKKITSTDLTEASAPFKKSFPLAVDKEALDKIRPRLWVTRHENNKNSSVLHICEAKEFIERESIDPNKIPNLKESGLDGYETIVGTRRTREQYYHCAVFHWDREVLEIRIDGAKALNEAEIIQTLSGMKKRIIDCLYTEDQKPEFDVTPLNVFPAISKLYQEKQGVITEIGFITSTNSIKKERMRQKMMDLRQEAYHKAGKNAVGKLNIFMIAKTWVLTGAISKPELVIPAGHGVAEAPKPYFSYVFILNCGSEPEYNEALDNLLSALST